MGSCFLTQPNPSRAYRKQYFPINSTTEIYRQHIVIYPLSDDYELLCHSKEMTGKMHRILENYQD